MTAPTPSLFVQTVGGYVANPAVKVPYQRHSATSRAGADSARSTAQHDAEVVLAALRAAGPMSDEQIYRHLIATGKIAPKKKESTIRARRIGLVAAGLVADSGRRVTTASGHTAVAWAAVEGE